KRRRAHLREARVHEWKVLRRERRQVRSAKACRGEQYARLDPRVGHVLSRLAIGIEDSCTEQHTHRLASPRVPCCGNAASVETPAEAWNRRFDKIKLVKDALQVFDAIPPDQWCTGIVRGNVQRPRVEMGGLNDHEAVSSPI